MKPFVVDFNAKMEKLQALLHQLGNQIRKARLVQAQVYQLPQISKEDTHKPCRPLRRLWYPVSPRVSWPFRVSPIFMPPGNQHQSRVSIARCTGTDAPYPFADIVSEINQIKDTIAELGKDHLNAAQRFRLMTHHHHGMVRLQLTHHLHIVCDPPISATYTWSARPMSYTVNGQQVVTLLKMIQSMPANERYEGHLPGRKPSRRKSVFPLAATPRVPHSSSAEDPSPSIYDSDNWICLPKCRKRQFMAHTPVIYLGKKTPKLGTLKPYVPRGDLRPKKNDPVGISEDPLSAFLDLYEVADA